MFRQEYLLQFDIFSRVAYTLIRGEECKKSRKIDYTYNQNQDRQDGKTSD